MEGAKSVDTPFVKEDGKEDEELKDFMDKDAAKEFRRSAARINYMSLERPDLGQASKEISKKMSQPRIGDEKLIKRLIRYLLRYPTMVSYFDYQKHTRRLTVFTDSDWANDAVTRKSTSGGAILWGTHLISHWSRVQNNVALSSGEAELNSSVKGLSEVIGIINFGCRVRN